MGYRKIKVGCFEYYVFIVSVFLKFFKFCFEKRERGGYLAIFVFGGQENNDLPGFLRWL